MAHKPNQPMSVCNFDRQVEGLRARVRREASS
ncbi:hypothetical protein GALL_553400 [mine drainage metagenome]|uniref:Uncharacterized protein n=1 Tax=mine drainage metagenome TaxID=410659 RepID=A0A1J5NY33_9ZZZZ